MAKAAVDPASGEAEAEEDARAATQLLEQAGRDASVLTLREAQLTASHHIPALRRAARDVLVTIGIA